MLKILSIIIHFLVNSLRISYRYRYLGVENLKQAQKLSKNGNYLLGIWHQNLMHGIVAQKGVPHIVIVSRSNDATPVAYTCQKFGNKVVRGSSKKGTVDKGGSVAKSEMIEELKSGLPGAVTIDGPKGPPKEVKSGIIDMARKSGTSIVPYTTRASSYWSFYKSWDKFRLPKPFSKIIVHYGTPIEIKEDLDFNDFSLIKEKLKGFLDQDEVYVDQLFKDFKTLPKENIS